MIGYCIATVDPLGGGGGGRGACLGGKNRNDTVQLLSICLGGKNAVMILYNYCRSVWEEKTP